jgi:hypothetical protein
MQSPNEEIITDNILDDPDYQRLLAKGLVAREYGAELDRAQSEVEKLQLEMDLKYHEALTDLCDAAATLRHLGEKEYEQIIEGITDLLWVKAEAMFCQTSVGTDGEAHTEWLRKKDKERKATAQATSQE